MPLVKDVGKSPSTALYERCHLIHLHNIYIYIYTDAVVILVRLTRTRVVHMPNNDCERVWITNILIPTLIF